jgi:ribonuclease-3
MHRAVKFFFAKKHKIDRTRCKELKGLGKKFGLRFKNLELINRAFAHRSFAFEKLRQDDSNERLEFLGDSILGAVISDYLFHKYPFLQEGELSKLKSQLVNWRILAKITQRLQIAKYLLLGRGEEQSGGRDQAHNLSCALEALIAALYLDQGERQAKKFILQIFSPELKILELGELETNYKSVLQEYSLKKLRILPRYAVVQEEGPDHKKTFEVEVSLGEKSISRARGKNKKTAEQQCAKLALENLGVSFKPKEGERLWQGRI